MIFISDQQLFKEAQFLMDQERKMLVDERRATNAGRATIALAIASISLIVMAVGMWTR
jgi:hypothetical protein